MRKIEMRNNFPILNFNTTTVFMRSKWINISSKIEQEKNVNLHNEFFFLLSYDKWFMWENLDTNGPQSGDKISITFT